MAEKDIKRSIPKDLFDPIGDSAEKNKARLETLIAELNILVEIAKKIKGEIPKAFPKGGGVDPKAAKSVEELTTLQIKANQVAKNKLAIDEEIRKERIALQEQNKKQNQALRDQIALENKHIGTLERLQVENRKLRREREQLNLETEKGQMRLKQINAQLDKNNSIIEKSSDKLKQQKIGIGQYKKAVQGLTTALNRLGIAFGVFSLLRDSFGIIKDFDQSMQNLGAITRQDTSDLRELAKELGSSTVFTANEAADAMTKLAMAGFNTNQILKATPGVLNLAAAGNLDLAKSADIASNVLSGFGLQAEELDRVVDVLARTATSTNTTVESLGESFKEIAPTANNLDIDIEEVSAAIGLLGNSGIKGTDATNVLNSALNRLSKPTKEMREKMEDLNIEFFDSNGQFIGLTQTISILNDRFKGLTDEQRANAISTLFGARANKQMTSLINGQVTAMIDGTEQTLKGAEALEFLTAEYENASGAAQEMADTQINSVSGSLKLLRSAWEGFILDLSESTDASNSLRDSIKFLAENLRTILGVVGSAVKFLLIYKTRLIAVNTAQKILNATSSRGATRLGLLVKAIISGKRPLGDFIKGVKDLSKGTDEGSKKFKKLGSALKGVGWTAAIFAVEKYISAIRNAINGNVQFERTLRRVNKQLQRGSDRAEKRVETRRKDLKEQQKQAKSEEERVEIAKRFQELTKQDIRLANERKAQAKERLENLNKLRDSTKGFGTDLLEFNKDLADELGFGSFGQAVDFKDIRQAISKTEADIRGINAALTIYSEELEGGQDNVDSLTESLSESNSNLKDQAESIKEVSKELKDLGAIQEKNIQGTIDFDRLAQEVEENKIIEDERKKSQARINVLEAELSGDKQKIIEARIAEIEANLELETQFLIEGTAKRIELEKDAELQIKQLREQATEDEQAELAKRLENQKKYIAFSEQLFTKNIDARIEKLDEETKASEKSVDDITKAAQQGSDTAEQSLAVENQKIAQANAEKERLERRKQQVLLVSSILQSYNSNLSAGDESGEALAKAITGTEVLSQFISALPAFMEGTEDTGTNGRGVDGKGGFHAILHENEGVIKKETNVKKLNAGLTNESAVDYAIKYKDLINSDFKQFDYDKQIHVGLDNHLVVNEMMKVGEKIDDLTKVIKSQPVYDGTEIRDVHSKMYELVRTIKKGNKKFTDINRFNA